MPLSARRLVPPLLRQLAGDPLALGHAAQSAVSEELVPRTRTADKVVQSICPYCAVGCGQLVYVQDEKVTQIEGDPASPVSRGRLCPKGAATKQLVTNPARETRVRYRRPGGTDWEALDLDTAMDRIAPRRVCPPPGARGGAPAQVGRPAPGTRSGAGAPAGPWPSPGSAARRSTTRRTTSSRSWGP